MVVMLKAPCCSEHAVVFQSTLFHFFLTLHKWKFYLLPCPKRLDLSTPQKATYPVLRRQSKMPTSTAPPRPRVVGLTVVTLVATLALLLTYGYQRPSHVTIGELVVRQPASINISTAEPSVTFSSSPLGNIALPFGRQDHAFHFSPISKWPLVKRVLGPEYQCLVEKGKRYYTDGVLPAFAGVSNFATPPFTQDSFKANGWSVNGPIDEPLPLHWEDAFKLIPEGAPADGDDSDRDNEISRIYVDQSLPFTNAQGSMVGSHP